MDDAKRIVELYTPRAYAIALRLTGNRSEAWDLVQNAMIRVLKSYETSFDPSYKVEQWLYRILRNLYIDRLRWESRRRESPLEEPGQDRSSPADTLAEAADGPEQALDRESDREAVRSALGELPVELRMAVILVDLEGCSYEEAAAALEIPVSTLGVHVFRGRRLLRDKLAGLLGG